MTPNDSIEGPARWKLIEATNGYDLDNSLYQNPGPVPPGPATAEPQRTPGTGRRAIPVGTVRGTASSAQTTCWTCRGGGLEGVIRPAGTE